MSDPLLEVIAAMVRFEPVTPTDEEDEAPPTDERGSAVAAESVETD